MTVLLPLFVALLVQATPVTPAPTVEAEQLGRQLANSGVLATVLPMMSNQQTEDLVAAHPELNDADKATLRATASEVARAGIDRLLAAEGHAYAAALAVDDLRVLVAAADSAEARHLRAAQPRVIAATMQAVGTMDFKGDALVAFCAKAGKACPAKP
jgi:hypothetical protein